jgi:hypothetical protein
MWTVSLCENEHLTSDSGSGLPCPICKQLRGEPFVVDRLADPDLKVLGAFTKGSTTSRQAAIDNYPRQGKQRWKILHYLFDMGEVGGTRAEIAVSLHLKDSSTDGRCIELIHGNWVESNGKTRLTDTGSKAEVLVLTEMGRNAVAEERATL